MDTKKLSEISIIFIAVVILIFLLQWLSSILRPLIIAIILSFLIMPLLRVPKENRNIEILKVIGKVGAVFIILLLFVGFSFNNIRDFQQSEDIESNSIIDIISNKEITFFDNSFKVSQYIDSQRIQELLTSTLNALFEGFAGFISEFFLIIFMLVFLVPLQNIWLTTISSNKKYKHISKTIFSLEESIFEYFKSKTLISFGTALSSFLVMFFLGVEYALLFSLLIFILNFIPTFGDYISYGIIFAIYAITQGIDMLFIGLVIGLFSINIIWGSIIEPKFTGNKLELSPVVIIVSLLFWGFIWGIGGMFFAVPLTLAIKSILETSTSSKELLH
ncbi:MAG: AI-2E family transporter [Nanoarchaeota archaeon]|nr:AI-2E family transporter [Nanoarchaeota archaeon]